MMSKELYIQVEKCLADSESEAAVCHIKELKKLGESDNKDLLRLERVCLDQLYYLLNESLNRCDVVSSQRLTYSYLSLKNDGRIALMQQKLKSLEKQEQLKSSSGNVNCDSVSEKNGRRFFKRSNILKIAGFILVLSIIIGIIVYTDEQGMWADKAMTAAVETTMISENNGKSASNRHGWVLSRAYFCEGDMAGFPIQMNIYLDDVGTVTGFYKNVRYGTELQLSGELNELGYLYIKAGNRNESVTFLLSKDSNSTLYGYGENTAKRLAVHLRIRE